jgi:hypothetical protein
MYILGPERLKVEGVVMGGRQRKSSSGLYEVKYLCSRKDGSLDIRRG